MTPLVSIITPTYQATAVEIRRCLTSVLRQTMGDFEHIVASDGLHEPIVAAAVGEAGDPRIRYLVSERHHGNFGNGVRQEVMMRHARGRYLVFFDDDNVIFPRYLERLSRALADTRDQDTMFATCEQLHFGPLQSFLGDPPVVLTGEPKLYYIDTLQVMVRADAMRSVGWNTDHPCADGIGYQELAGRYPHARVPECLCVHL
jgi:teichuronic acid biosynthesis glycosyltransferase TuaG